MELADIGEDWRRGGDSAVGDDVLACVVRIQQGNSRREGGGGKLGGWDVVSCTALLNFFLHAIIECFIVRIGVGSSSQLGPLANLPVGQLAWKGY